jgi:hypothetical protein
MKYIILFTLIACNSSINSDLTVDSCVLGEDMVVWQLIREDDGKYLFSDVPVKEGAMVHVFEDISALKKVDCPKL